MMTKSSAVSSCLLVDSSTFSEIIPIFEENMTACDLENSFTFNNNKPRALSDLCVNIIVVDVIYVYELWALHRLQTAKVTFKLTQGHWQSNANHAIH